MPKEPGASEILQNVNRYYSQKIREFSVTPQGVDWNSVESQSLRFSQLCRVLPPGEGFSVLDFGCGYGALWDELAARKINCGYLGYDISVEMIEAARRLHPAPAPCRFTTRPEELEPADYLIASGIFNVKMQHEDSEWKNYILETLDGLDRLGTRGFSFNMLTSYSDADKMRPNLYYADPCFFFDLCKKKYSRQVAVLHDYGLYEFTILVRKHL